MTFDRVGPKVVKFSVQYLAKIDEEWHPIVRFDTAHGRAHKDISLPGEEQITEVLSTQDYRRALTECIADIRRNWQEYRARFERWSR